MNKTVYGVFDSNAEVIQAINALKAKGYDGDDITVVANHEDTLDFTNFHRTPDVKTLSNDQENESFMDKVRHFFVDEERTTFTERLTAEGLSDREATTCISDVEDGKVLVLLDQNQGNGLNAGATNLEQSRLRDDELLSDSASLKTGDLYGSEHGTLYPNDIPDTSVDYRTGYINNNLADTTDDLTEEERTLRLREEQLEVDKERVQTGEVVINKEVTEEKKTMNVPVEHEEVYIERRSATGDATDAGPIGDDETIRIPVVEEKLEVTKKPVVTDEIVVGKRTVQETQQVQDTVKKEDVQLDSDGNPFIQDRTRKNKDNREF